MFFSLQFLTLITALFLIPILVLRYRRLQSIPGPLVASFTDLWQAYYQNVDNFTNTLAKLHNQYGAFVRLGPNRVSLGDAAAVSSIYTMHGEFRKVRYLTEGFGILTDACLGRIVSSFESTCEWHNTGKHD